MKLDKYDLILEKLGYNYINNSTSIDDNVDVEIDKLTELLNELGIVKSSDDEYKLILWNDEVNDMLHVMLALFEICQLSNEKSMEIMLEAHTNGKAVAKTGSFDELNEMKKALNKRNIEATIEK